MYSQESERPIVAFLRKCYEIGNTPILGTKKETKVESPLKTLEKHSKNSRDSLARFMDQGIVKRNAQGQFTLNGEDFYIDENTFVVGDITPGDVVRIVGVIRSGKGRYATKVSIVKKVG